jgi:cytochrome c556
MRNILIIASLGVAVLVAGATRSTWQSDPTKRELMKAKAGYAHRLLDAVVQNDFDAMQDQAFRLKAVTETADWSAVKTPWFVRESDAFVVATDRLYQAAKEKNGTAAALAYVDLTLRCVRCHQTLRQTQ